MYPLLHDYITQYTDEIFSFLKKGILKYTVAQTSKYFSHMCQVVNFSGNVTYDLICHSYCYLFLTVKFVREEVCCLGTEVNSVEL